MYLTNDETGEVGEFNKPQPGWSDSTQEEIDACMLQCAKEAKFTTLHQDRIDFCAAGFNYLGNVFCISDESTQNIVLKNELDADATDRWKYYDDAGNQINFTDQYIWGAFFDEILSEKDRVMMYYCATKKAISDAATVAAVEAITIDFS